MSSLLMVSYWKLPFILPWFSVFHWFVNSFQHVRPRGRFLWDKVTRFSPPAVSTHIYINSFPELTGQVCKQSSLWMFCSRCGELGQMMIKIIIIRHGSHKHSDPHLTHAAPLYYTCAKTHMLYLSVAKCVVRQRVCIGGVEGSLVILVLSSC